MITDARLTIILEYMMFCLVLPQCLCISCAAYYTLPADKKIH